MLYLFHIIRLVDIIVCVNIAISLLAQTWISQNPNRRKRAELTNTPWKHAVGMTAQRNVDYLDLDKLWEVLE